MKREHEFEIVTDRNTSFKIFINVLKYRTPHLHMDYEIGLVMRGEMDLVYEDSSHHLTQGDIMCVNPYQIHEFRSDKEVQLLLLQINPTYFLSTYPQIKHLEFTSPAYSADNGILYTSAHDNIVQLALSYMEHDENYEFRCAGFLNHLFYDLLKMLPHKYISHSETQSVHNKAARIRHIADYIEQHQDEKILLSDIAKKEHLTLDYLSHFFKDNFHMSFQEYMTRLRCERARMLMLTTDLSLFDISISCGFSDPKYFKKGFISQYGCSPREYRHNFGKQKLSGQQTSMLTTQQILSRQTSLVLLQQYMDCQV